MSSTNKTSLGLNMWEASDKPVRQDFINDNVIIDERISELNNNYNVVDEKISELNSNLTYKTGDTYTIPTNFPLQGYISGSATMLFFLLVLPKTANGLSVQSIECSNFTVRSINGYLVQDVLLSSVGTVTTIIKDNLIRVYITSGTAFSTKNNTPISVEGAMTVTFQ